jgi:alkanesulfonate monooxygenase SsuD/methylene tetrahydromethanopterin reductase-like flavin-dependent oxidoreductase (luciferase family)
VKGRWHQVPDAGLNPLPVQRPIPIWMGGESERVVRRATRVADGWMPDFRPGPEAQVIVDRVHRSIKEAGRDPARFGIEGRLSLPQVPRDQWAKELAAWRAMRRVTHVSVNTMNAGLKTPAEHIETLRRFKEEAGVSSQPPRGRWRLNPRARRWRAGGKASDHDRLRNDYPQAVPIVVVVRPARWP